MDRFYQLNPKIFEDYANIGKKATSIRTILKLIQHIKQVKANLMPFIKNPKDMTIWSNEYFLQLAKMINIEQLRYLPFLSHGASFTFENGHKKMRQHRPNYLFLYSQRGAINKKEAGWKTGPPCYFYQNTFTKRSMSTESPTEKVRPVVIAELQ